MFEYDAFLSFSAKDIDFVKPVWQRLMLSGLRVFWSDEDLKATAGKSFVSTIQNALVGSRDFVLCWTEHARNSSWVEEEYQAFYSQCYMPAKASRRLLIFSPDTSHFATLPPFLKQLQALTSVDQLVSNLDGVDIDRLRNENLQLRTRIAEMTSEMETLKRPNSAVMSPPSAVVTLAPGGQPAEFPEPVGGWRLRVLESSGHAHDLTNVSIKYPGSAGPINERRGIRVQNGTAESLLKWSHVLTLAFRPLTEAVDVFMPQMGESISEGTVVKWLRSVGDNVERDEPMLEISTEKVDAEIPCPTSGTIIEILVSEGTTVPVMSVLARVAAERRDQPQSSKYSYLIGATLRTGRLLWLTLTSDLSMEAGGTGLLFGDSELGETAIRFANIHTIMPANPFVTS